MYNSYFIALGSNLTSSSGCPANTLQAALKELLKNGVVIRETSPFYHTPAFPAGSGPNFVNAVALVSCERGPGAFLDLLHDIEAEMGRVRQVRWGQRTLDLDLIASGAQVLPDRAVHQQWRDLSLERQMQEAPAQLILPHPRLQDRAFVLVPLADIAPDWRHPVLGRSVRQMLEALPDADKAAVQPVK